MNLAAKTTSTIIPCLRFRNAVQMIDWLCDAFGFEKHAVHADGDTVGSYDPWAEGKTL